MWDECLYPYLQSQLEVGHIWIEGFAAGQLSTGHLFVKKKFESLHNTCIRTIIIKETLVILAFY